MFKCCVCHGKSSRRTSREDGESSSSRSSSSSSSDDDEDEHIPLHGDDDEDDLRPPIISECGRRANEGTTEYRINHKNDQIIVEVVNNEVGHLPNGNHYNLEGENKESIKQEVTEIVNCAMKIVQDIRREKLEKIKEEEEVSSVKSANEDQPVQVSNWSRVANNLVNGNGEVHQNETSSCVILDGIKKLKIEDVVQMKLEQKEEEEQKDQNVEEEEEEDSELMANLLTLIPPPPLEQLTDISNVAELEFPTPPPIDFDESDVETSKSSKSSSAHWDTSRGSDKGPSPDCKSLPSLPSPPSLVSETDNEGGQSRSSSRLSGKVPLMINCDKEPDEPEVEVDDVIPQEEEPVEVVVAPPPPPLSLTEEEIPPRPGISGTSGTGAIRRTIIHNNTNNNNHHSPSHSRSQNLLSVGCRSERSSVSSNRSGSSSACSSMVSSQRRPLLTGVGSARALYDTFARQVVKAQDVCCVFRVMTKSAIYILIYASIFLYLFLVRLHIELFRYINSDGNDHESHGHDDEKQLQ